MNGEVRQSVEANEFNVSSVSNNILEFILKNKWLFICTFFETCKRLYSLFYGF